LFIVIEASNTIQGEPNVTVGLQGDLHIKDPGNTSYTNFTGSTDAGIIVGNGLLDSAGLQLRTGTSGSCKVNFGDGDGSSSDRSKGFVHYTHSDNSMQIGTNSSERMRIDSAGRVTKPNTPAFLAYHHSHDLTYTSGDTLAYMHESFDIGSNYNTSNYTFTAPIAGRYLFSASANADYDSSLSGIPRAYWKINGANVANSIHLRGSDNANTGTDADGLEQRSQTVIFNLSANDTVRIDVGQNQWDLFGANSFSGYLLG
jgi:hypothetical protein